MVQQTVEKKTSSIKVGIVGPQLSKWPKELIPKAKDTIRQILLGNYLLSVLDTGQPIILVSGHCPVGKELWYCVDCNKWNGCGKEPNMHPTEELTQSHRVIKVFDEGGVDTWAEIEAARLGLKTEIYPAEAHQWPDLPHTPIPKEGLNLGFTHQCSRCGAYWDGKIWSWDLPPARNVCKLGYRSRNIQIAKAFDIGFCIVPHVEGKSCYHHPSVHIDHPRNGGCWTIRYAKEKLGKTVRLVVIR